MVTPVKEGQGNWGGSCQCRKSWILRGKLGMGTLVSRARGQEEESGRGPLPGRRIAPLCILGVCGGGYGPDGVNEVGFTEEWRHLHHILCQKLVWEPRRLAVRAGAHSLLCFPTRGLAGRACTRSESGSEWGEDAGKWG